MSDSVRLPAWTALRAAPEGPRYRLARPAVLPRPRARIRQRMSGAGAPPPRRQRRRPSPWRSAARAAWAAAVAPPRAGGALPVAVRVVSPRASTLRLLALYAYAGLGSGPALLLLCWPRAAAAWVHPANLGPATLAAVLAADAVAMLACVGLALRSRLLHPLELALPRPRPLVVGLATVLVAAALRFAGPGGPALAGGIAGALLAARQASLLAVLLCLLLPAAQAGFFFGLLQGRLQDVLPAWAACALPAAAFALSGPLTGVPLPALLPAFAIGLLLAVTRREAGAGGTAFALAAGGALALGLAALRP